MLTQPKTYNLPMSTKRTDLDNPWLVGITKFDGYMWTFCMTCLHDALSACKTAQGARPINGEQPNAEISSYVRMEETEEGNECRMQGLDVA